MTYLLFNPKFIWCPNCRRKMKWEAYTAVKRPDVLRQRDKKAPIHWAWHCRCGMWDYHSKPPRR